ncbi:hypothetical protein E3N88_38803 [Mikania micrantha]|uniref:Uncharacterized protein n=1 Tax=Mikania micrantha TaxID=192012 RepID=A0A5N6LV06_9ASTR|nr:hypothetical protein E3N88_38803 [Mikania micrantha]
MYPKPKVYSRPRLRKIEQNWNSYFKFWFDDERTSEAVILLKENEKWRVIRLLDPVWLVNCLKKDIDLLNEVEIYASEGFHEVGKEIDDRDAKLEAEKLSKIPKSVVIHAEDNVCEDQTTSGTPIAD